MENIQSNIHNSKELQAEIARLEGMLYIKEQQISYDMQEVKKKAEPFVKAADFITEWMANPLSRETFIRIARFVLPYTLPAVIRKTPIGKSRIFESLLNLGSDFAIKKISSIDVSQLAAAATGFFSRKK